jgi:predicted nuclease of predicted toxin-antitoxin system
MPSTIARELRRQGVDVVTTGEAGLLGTPDTAQLAHAHATGRVMVTQDKDFLRLNDEGVNHSGIAYSRHGTRTIGQLVAALIRIHRSLDAERMVDWVEYL